MHLACLQLAGFWGSAYWGFCMSRANPTRFELYPPPALISRSHQSTDISEEQIPRLAGRWLWMCWAWSWPSRSYRERWRRALTTLRQRPAFASVLGRRHDLWEVRRWCLNRQLKAELSSLGEQGRKDIPERGEELVHTPGGTSEFAKGWRHSKVFDL